MTIVTYVPSLFIGYANKHGGMIFILSQAVNTNLPGRTWNIDRSA
jgi:hypothetical protein